MFPENKHKAVTFSFDDGVTQDRRLVALFNKYHLKCTFNLNSLTLGKTGSVEWQGKTVSHNKIEPNEVKTLYYGHEVAVHTLNHLDLCSQSDEIIIKEVEEDRLNLEKLVGYPVVGMAYPYGAVDQRVIKILETKTKIKYSRGIDDTLNFNLQTEHLLNYRPTIRSLNFDGLNKLVDTFLNLTTDEDKVLYIWGHAYEFDFDNTWDKFEDILKKLANRKDIFYGTNREVLIKE